MKRNTDINKKILKRFDKLLDSGAAIEECLEKFPGHKDELAAYASITRNLKYLQNIKPEKTVEDHCLKMVYSKSRISNIADDKETLKRDAAIVRMRPAYLKPLVIFLGVFIFISFSFTGTIYASDDSLPGDTLYSVKRVSESVAVAFTPYKYEKSIYLKMLDERLFEADTILNNPEYSNTEAAEKLISDIDETFNRCCQRKYLDSGSSTFFEERVRHMKEGLHNRYRMQGPGTSECTNQPSDTSGNGSGNETQNSGTQKNKNQGSESCINGNYGNTKTYTQDKDNTVGTEQAGTDQGKNGAQYQNGK